MIAALRGRLRDIPKAWWLLPFLSVAVAFLWRGQGGLDRLESVSYDQRLRTFSPPPTLSPDLLLVAVDGASMRGIQRNAGYHQAFGNYPFTRTLWYRVVDQILSQGARAVVLDILFEEESNPEPDDRLAAWLSQTHPPVYFAVNVDRNGEALPRVDAINRMPAPRYVSPKGDVLGGAKDASPTSETGIAGADDTGIPGADGTGIAGDAAAPDPAKVRADRDLAVARALAFPVRLEGLSANPFTPSDDPDGAADPRPRRIVPPIPQLIANGAGFGLTLHEEDADGTMRRTHFVFTDGANTYVTLATAAAADLLGATSVTLSRGRLTLGPRALKIDPDGSAELDFQGDFSAHYPVIPLLSVLDDSVHREKGQPLTLARDAFRDKVVFISGTGAGTYDVKSTPFDSRAPGVSKVMSELESLLHGRFITDAPRGSSEALALAFCLLSVLLVWGGQSAWAELLAPILALAGLFALTGVLLARGHLHVQFARPAIAVALTCVGAVVAHRLSVSKERERVKAIFGQFVAKQVVEQLVSQPTLPRLDGEEKEITAFFSDIKGFSTFSEKLKDDPRKLVRMLNTYLTRVSGVLQKHGGCLDKYIGDAVVCIFGAPLTMEDHAVRACRAALEVQRELTQLREEFRAQGLPDVYTRIGMNSAVMFVGNFGSEQLFNYTAMGDGMNLASRLEGANKPYGSAIMIGPRTLELARDHVEARELDAVRVAGKHEPVRVYELLALKGELSETKARAVERYSVALASFRQGRFADAVKMLEDALSIDPGDAPSQALLERCRAYAVEPPPGFDGITQLEK